MSKPKKKSTNDIAFERGWDDYINGIEKTKNPYTQDIDAAKDWLDGWIFASKIKTIINAFND